MEVITGTRTFSPGEKVVIAGTEMFFSHWITTPNGERPFFHYYIDGKEYGYINHGCNCGKIYGETCTNKINDCPEFLYHRAMVEAKFSPKQNPLNHEHRREIKRY
jgi:hypothetical protein